jgi:putative SOS response-associated peptidase YedK
MCNLYSLTRNKDAIARLFRVSHNRAADYAPLPAIFPGHAAPVIRPSADGERELVVMSWGFVLPQPGKAPRRVTNTRDDKVLGSRFWRDSFETRRCLVPATAFCEPHDGRKPATWHWFALKGEEPRPPFAFAGLWRRWVGPIKKDGPTVEIDTYSFMTTAPNALTIGINHERSPVLLTSAAECDAWMHGTPDAALALVRPLTAERMHIVQEGFDKADLLAAW